MTRRTPPRPRRAASSANDEIIAGIVRGSIKVSSEISQLVLEQAAKKPPVKRIQAAPKPPIDSGLTPAQVALQAEQARDFADLTARPGSAGMGIVCRARARTIPGEMNGLEAAYAERLEAAKRAGEIADYRYEQVRLKTGVGSWYTADFYVVLPDGRTYLVEVKPFRLDGEKVIRIANEDAVQKVKACVQFHPFPILWALGKVIPKRDGGGHEWREEWAGGIQP